MKNKFYFKGEYFDNEQDFWKAVNDWPFKICTEEDFEREWKILGKDIWLNMEIHNISGDLKNEDLVAIFEEVFLRIFNNYIAADKSNQIKNMV